MLQLAEQFVPGDVLIREGDIGDKFFVVVRGRVRIAKGAGDDEMDLGVQEDGDVFGEIALLEDVPRTASVVAVTPCLCLTLDRPKFEALLDEQPKLRERVVRIARERLGVDEKESGSGT